LATGDEVMKFGKVKFGGEVCALLNALLVTYVFDPVFDSGWLLVWKTRKSQGTGYKSGKDKENE